MKNLLSLFARKHRPDVEGLSAYVDGRLDATASAEIEAHVDGCEVCATELAGLRSVQTMLSSMGSVPAPRSFRVRQADLERAGAATLGRADRRPSGALAFAPALSALAVVLLVGVVWLDAGTRDGSDNNQQPSAERASAPAPQAALTQDSAGGVAADTADGDAASTPLSGLAPPSDEASQGEDGQIEDSDDEEPASEASRGQDENFEASTAAPGAIEEQPAASPTGDDAQALTSDSEDDGDDGLRPGFLALEIGLIALAVGAAGAFIYARWKRRVA